MNFINTFMEIKQKVPDTRAISYNILIIKNLKR